MVTPEADEVSDEEFSEMNVSSPSVEQRSRPGRDEGFRSRERMSPLSSQQDVDGSSAIVNPQNRVSDGSSSSHEQEDTRRQGPSQQRGKKTVAEQQSSELPTAQKHKSTDSDEDDEEPQNEPRTFQIPDQLHQYFLVILMMKTVNTATNTVTEVRIPSNFLDHPGVPSAPTGPPELPGPPDRSPAGDRDRAELKVHHVNSFLWDLLNPRLNLFRHHRKRGEGNGPDRVSEHLSTHKHHRNHKLNLWLLQSLMMDQMRTSQM